jgi:hypothetical protein
MNVWVKSFRQSFLGNFFLFGIKVNNGETDPLASGFIEKI